MSVIDGTKIGWHVAERWTEDTAGGAYGEDAVGTAHHVLYRKTGEPHKFTEDVYYVEYVRANNQPPVSTCPTCEREVNESAARNVFVCDPTYGGCGHYWHDRDAKPPMRYSVVNRVACFEGRPGQSEDEIRNDGQEQIDYPDADVLWHHSEEAAQRSAERCSRHDYAHMILY